MDDLLPFRLRDRLSRPLPGAPAQYKLAPFYRNNDYNEQFDASAYRLSAVMILLCRREAGRWIIPLTLRTEYPGTHSAQVSLPGGKHDPEDKSLEQTALRECFEEIGLADHIRVLGPLTTLRIPVSKYMVHPFVGVLESSDWVYAIHEREVQNIIELPLDVLLAHQNLVEGEVATGAGEKIRAPYFLFEGHRIWGATAMILSELKQLLQETEEVR